MGPRYLLLPFLLIISLSCESRLYPPTDPPILSDLVLTSSSYNSSTTKTFRGDTVFLVVSVVDPEEDPETLDLSITSEGTEVASEEYGESRIHDGISWEGWFETSNLAVGSYALNFTATDKAGNISETLSQSFSIETDLKTTVTTADITISAVSIALKDEVPDEPFTISFSLTNNSLVKLDLVYVPFTVIMDWDNPSDDPDDGEEEYVYSGTGIVSSIDPGDTVEGKLRLNILNGTYDNTKPVNDANENNYDEADCTITIY